MLPRFGKVVAAEICARQVRIGTARDGLLLDEPAVVAGTRTSAGRFRPRAAGYEAVLLARNIAEGWDLIWPFDGDSVVDDRASVFLLRRLMKVAGIRRLLAAPYLLVPVGRKPSDPALRPLLQVLRAAGFGGVLTVPAPVAALCGAGVSPGDSRPWLVVKIGQKRTGVYIASTGAVYSGTSFGIGTEDYAAALREQILESAGLVVPEPAEELTRVSVLTTVRGGQGKVPVRGVDRQTGLPATGTVATADVLTSFATYHRLISSRICGLLNSCPEHVGTALGDTGVLLCGPGALLPGLADAIREATGLPLFLPSRPELVIAEGACRCSAESRAWGTTLLVERAA